ncbi:NAD-dependent epimerase/dehydratase family protein [Acinetobacter calcoaceticus]|uniref:NAD-dependent epimerase/dehydratase family protein n=1 Tax=Acinetobacter calcoaceticus TaxID=471 RepID=UPI001AEB935B|nr:NAD-dependent epimerase/dehydratase family protein [Acinetobacter calcoaceticus]MBP2605823.1 nucleoside-diphosphate-sugar epimerase [Acinetobacter calcoaceticus]
MKILITGSNGFVGSHLCEYFSTIPEYRVLAQIREKTQNLGTSIETITFDLNDDLTNLDLSSVDVVVHCAGRAHIMKEVESEPLALYRQVNVEGTLKLAKKAAKAGVKRFIFMSSIKVNGEVTADKPFTPNDSVSNLQDPYGLSKFEAEQALLNLAQNFKMDVVIIRPVLIYGPEVKANFKSMVNLAAKGVPLPVGCLDNKRSMVSIYNLIDFIHACLLHPLAKNQIFLISDQDDITVKELFTKLAKVQGKKLIALPVPKVLINYVAKLFNKDAIASRLCSSLVVDTSKNVELLGWKAPYSVDDCLNLMFKKN